MKVRQIIHRFLACTLILAFMVSDVSVYAQGVVQLPASGTRLALSPAFVPPLLKGIKVYRNDPFRFDFILDKGDDRPDAAGNGRDRSLQDESLRLIKYIHSFICRGDGKGAVVILENECQGGIELSDINVPLRLGAAVIPGVLCPFRKQG